MIPLDNYIHICEYRYMSILTQDQLEAIAARFRVMGDPCRLRILSFLMQGERTVGEVIEEVGSSQPNVSRHLRALFTAGLVDRRRNGNSVHYSVTDPVISDLCKLMCNCVERDAKHAYKKLSRRKS
jgi:DNA-binding transcriptional ArsR family regulator